MKNVAELLRQSYLDSPDQTALVLLHNRLPDQELNFRTLIQGAAGYARALAAAGVQPGQVVVLILKHGQELVYSFFGALLHGAIPSIMPFLTEKLSPGHYRQSLASLIEITSPAAMVTYAEFLPEVQAARAGTAVQAVLVSGEVPPAAELDFGSNHGGLGAGEFDGLRRSPDEIVLLQHSSGTTGLQKGVALSHQAVFNQLESYAEALRLNHADVIVSWLPLYHDMGLIAGFILPILSRVPLVLMSAFDWVRAPFKLFHAISHYRGTLCWLPNFAYNFCAQKIRDRDLENIDLSSLRAVSNCSEPMHWKSHQLFLERFQPYGLRPQALATCYAMAENVFAVTQGGVDGRVTVDTIRQDALLTRQLAEPAAGESGAVKMLSAGRPIRHTCLRVLGTDGKDLPERQIGEIAIQSNCMLTGYYHRPDLTEKAFLDGWYLTGDLGYLANGELYVTGRKKDLIIVGGKNVYPQDLERLAGEIQGVYPGRVVAFGVYNEQTGTEDVVIVAEAQDDHQAEDPELAGQIGDEIRRYVTRASDIALRYVQVVERNWLLKTSSGKIARAANREKYLAQGTKAI